MSTEAPTKPILCIDFDGVIHRYDSGWEGATVITDDATEGFWERNSTLLDYRAVLVQNRRTPRVSDSTGPTGSAT